MSNEEKMKCRMATLIVKTKDGEVEIPVAVCKLGKKYDFRVPDPGMIEDLFKEEKK
jgi:hypothetical protein